MCARPCSAVRSGAKGRLKLQYVVRDKGPRLSPPAHWVPQLQLHMLATGCHSLLLLSRSATRGSRIFRVTRDHAYVRAMLDTLSHMYCAHVLRQRAPPPNMFSKDSRYRALLAATARLGRQAAVLLVVGGPADEGSDSEAARASGGGGEAFVE